MSTRTHGASEDARRATDSEYETRETHMSSLETDSRTGGGRRSPLAWLRAGALLLAVALAAGACEDPLDVENPNNLVEDDVATPTAVPATVNGALATTARMIGEVNAIYATASDEVRWIGSRDAWNSLSQGNLDDPTNEFSDATFPTVGTARYMVDRAVRLAEQYDSEGELGDRVHLARAYLYAAITYVTIADAYDDFVMPESPTEPVPPVGADNMSQLYQSAVGFLNDGISVAQAIGNTELETRMLAMRARTHHAMGVWNKVNPAGSAPADPLVNSADAVADAQAVLDEVGTSSDWKYELTYSSATVTSNVAFQINQRGELQFGPALVQANPEDLTDIQAIVIQDPIDDVVDPVASATINSFTASDEFAPQTVVSAREMHLILAEAELAQADTSGYAAHVNHVRSMDGLTDYSGQVDPVSLLEHERQVNLLLQVRRIADMYRFGVESSEWLQQSKAVTEPGTFFPIAITEIRSNPTLGG